LTQHIRIKVGAEPARAVLKRRMGRMVKTVTHGGGADTIRVDAAVVPLINP
jgi:hypothetical protein